MTRNIFEGASSLRDPNSFSEPNKVKTNHIHLELKVDFQKKALIGDVVLSFTKINRNVKSFVLDVKNLKVNKISLVF